ncbi:MAG: glycerol-3-phosphate 1-O-acyltransferase PlsY [Armatimonadetes bacterium]|nr:glycerol-3-phosphate 1-O-acyltransferase PlsY [Armatimonadota bacterium]MDE2207004.1 glycerol-3-phosphate 1-O-acyltransferase PlsY [Armatimonadota bacterium]
MAAIWVLASYLLGSIPFGLWIARRFAGVDITAAGSGNIGSTNVMRVCGPRLAIVVFLLDVLKGFVPPFIVFHAGMAPSVIIMAAMAAIIGHNFSVWLGFRGGKGIATSLGALLGVSPLVGVSALAVFLLAVLVVRYISVGSILAAISLPVFMPIYYPHDLWRLGFASLAGVMALIKHRANIGRLLKGTEPRLNLRRRIARD